VVQYNYSRAKELNWWDWWNMHHIHSNVSEHMAFNRVITLAKHKNVAIYFAHVSAHESLYEVQKSKSEGFPIYVETLHNYLGFNCEHYKEQDGMKYHTYPSLKPEEDRIALWKGLLNGDIDTVATDLVATDYQNKTKYKTVCDCTGGHNGIETRMGIVYTEGVAQRGMSLRRFVDVTSTNPAKILGLYPQKGVIQVGSDADLAIIDPSIKKKLNMSDLHLPDYSIWEGWPIKGWTVTTLLRGKIMVHQGQLLGTPTDGNLIFRKMTPEVISRGK